MSEYSIGFSELMEFPYERYLEHVKILNIEAKHEKKKQEREKSKVDT